MGRDTRDLRQDLIRLIEDCIARDPANRSEDGSPYFETPLVRFASAQDDIFREYKSIIGPFHWSPTEALEHSFGVGGPAARTVICWVLPIAEETKASNRKEERHPSRKWAHTRHYGELFNDRVRESVVEFLSQHGGKAAAPMLLDGWKRVDDPQIGWASSWSERHAAYATGLGTFSLNDGFITPVGIAHRVGSVVTDLPVPASSRHYLDHRENCLTCRGIECGVCIKRCPVGAISLDGHDKSLCHDYTSSDAFKNLARQYEARDIGCGLCQTDVPCEQKIPDSKLIVSDLKGD